MEGLNPLHKAVVGIDVHRMLHVITVLVENDDGALSKHLQSFGGFKRDMKAMALWLLELGVEWVVMESTGIYWKRENGVRTNIPTLMWIVRPGNPLASLPKAIGYNNLEGTRVTDRARIKRLLVVPVVAPCWAHKIGEWRHEAKPIKVKKHRRLAKSIFRCGLDWLRDNLLKTVSKLGHVCQTFVQLVECKSICCQL
jgi:hypothetical protein